MSERNLAASPRRIEKAKRNGQVARAPELVSELIFLWCLLVLGLCLSLPVLAKWFHGVLSACMSSMGEADPWAGAAATVAKALAPGLALLGLLFLGTLALAWAGSQWVAGGIPFSTEAFEFHPERLNPIQGLQKIFNGRAWGSAGLALAKLSGGLGVLSSLAPGLIVALVALPVFNPAESVGQALGLAKDLTLSVTGGLGVVAVAQAFWARHKWDAELRMTRQEAIEDSRESEGNPRVKKRFQGLHRRLARKRTIQAIAQADMVLANPTHVAVALSYKRGRMRAPKVLAKGADLMAQRIKEAARKLGIPVIEQPPLARDLYASVEVGHEVPARLYRAVARVFTHLQQLRPVRSAAKVPR